MGGPHNHHHDDDDIIDAAAAAPPSNERLLCTAFVSFQCFAIVQIVVAIIAGSEALLGDSFAMMVDAFTYLFNWFAERQKKLYAKKLQRQQQQGASLRALEYRKYTYQLELIPPLISVSTLLVVTVVVLKESIGVLVLDAKRDVSEQADPNVKLMMLFSFLNLLLDVLNVGCFASAKHALGYNTTPQEDEGEDGDGTERIPEQQKYSDRVERIHNNSNDTTRIRGNGENDDDNDCEIEMMERKAVANSWHDGNSNGNGTTGLDDPNHSEDDEDEDEDDDDEDEDDFDETSPMKGGLNGRRKRHPHDDGGEETSNLNMCSAYTHVFADTLRSLAVILASLLAEFTSAVTSEVADATAAVVVSLLIMLSLMPLFGGMMTTSRALKRVNRQILAERIRHGQQQPMTEEIDLVDPDQDDEEDDDDPPRDKAVIQFV